MVETTDPLSDVTDTHETTPVKGEDTRTVPLSALSAERRKATEARKAAEAAEARAKALEEAHAKLIADAEAWKKGHEAWTSHQTAESERATKALADRLANLPDDVREEIEAEIEDGMGAAKVLRWIERAEKLAGIKPADETRQEKPKQPVGGRGAAASPSPDELPPAVKEWVETRRPDLAGRAPAVIRKMYDSFSGAKAP